VLGPSGVLVATIPLGLSPAIATAAALDTTTAPAGLHRLAPTIAAVAGFVLLSAAASTVLWRRRE
jgi:hypothetical protein